jgi:ligand-binding sensor domain-containing protein
LFCVDVHLKTTDILRIKYDLTMKFFLLLFCLTIVVGTRTLSAPQVESYSNLQFKTFSTQQGLSQSSVLSLTQDPQGFIWMGTKDGLNRFDGYRFRTYKSESDNANSISNNEIIFLSSNSKGNIFVGTRGGSLNYFIKDENRFKKFENLEIIDGTVNSVTECNDGTILIGTNISLFSGVLDSSLQYEYDFTNLSKNSVYLTSNNTLLPYDRLSISVVTTEKLENETIIVGTFKGLFLYIPDDMSFTQIDIGRLNDAKITSMVWDNDSTLWIGTSEGLAKLYFENNKPNEVQFLDNHEAWNQTNATWVEKLICDIDGNLWIATRGAGVIMWDTTGDIHSYYNNSSLSYNIGDNIINSLLIDNSGILWIGTESRGVVTLDLYRKKFNHLENYTSTGRNLTSNLVTAITGNENEIWVGSAYNGLDYLRFIPDNKIETRHIEEIPYDNGLTSNEIISLCLDKQNKLWIGTASNYLVSLDKNGKFDSYPTGSFTFALHQDQQNDLWIGTWGKGLGLKEFQSDEIQFFSNQPHNSRSLSGDIILSVYDDSKGNLWIGTKGRGLNIISLDAIKQGYNNFIAYEKGEILHNDIYCILEDSEGAIWIGTGGGLNRIDLTNKETADSFMKGRAKFESFTEKDGLPANLIYGLIEDDKDLCTYLENALSQSFKIVTANDGEAGIIKALETLPSIIVSDVMMPNTDGLVLTQQLKTNEKTRHIPIILLTAKAADESKMEGYKSGADLYVSKPFKIDLLRIQIEQLLASRKVLSEIFSKQIMLKPRNIAISSADEKFLTRLNEVIDEHLPEPDFDVAAMVKRMNQSHSTVLKKIKSRQGMIPYLLYSIRCYASNYYSIGSAPKVPNKLSMYLSDLTSLRFLRAFSSSKFRFIRSAASL